MNDVLQLGLLMLEYLRDCQLKSQPASPAYFNPQAFGASDQLFNAALEQMLSAGLISGVNFYMDPYGQMAYSLDGVFVTPNGVNFLSQYMPAPVMNPMPQPIMGMPETQMMAPVQQSSMGMQQQVQAPPFQAPIQPQMPQPPQGGYPAQAQAASNVPKKKGKGKIVVIILLVLLLLAGGFGAVVYFIDPFGWLPQEEQQQNDSKSSAMQNPSPARTSGHTISLPKGLYAGMGLEPTQAISSLERMGATDVSEQADGTVTGTIPSDLYDALVEEMNTNLIDTLEGIPNSEEYPDIVGVEYNDDITEIAFTINSDAPSMTTSIAGMAAAMPVLFYQQIADVEMDCTVQFVDASGNVLDEQRYPQLLEEMAKEAEDSTAV